VTRLQTIVATDVVALIAGIEPGSPADRVRAGKPEYVEQNESYYRAVFEPNDESEVAFPARDRALVAIRVASHTRSTAVIDWYTRLARDVGATEDQIAAVSDLSSPVAAVDSKLAAAITRADRVTLAPDTTTEDQIAELREAGFSPAGILSLSQTIAFVSYQLRHIAGLRALGVLA
jgi:uncharacterized protein YciW